MNRIEKREFLTSKESDTITKIILSLEDDIKRIGPDMYWGTSDNSLTGRYYCFNLLYVDDDVGRRGRTAAGRRVIDHIIRPKLKEIFGSCVVQCWANTFRKGEGIREHRHCESESSPKEFYASVNIFLKGDPSIGTYYEGVKHESKVGLITIFPTDMFHSVPPNPGHDIRVSMAMDVFIGSHEFMSGLVNEQPQRYVYIK